MCITCNSKSKSILHVSDCDITYQMIVEVELKLIQLIKLKNSERTTYFLINAQLRDWANNINETCPPMGNFNTLKDYVDNEYSEHIG